MIFDSWMVLVLAVMLQQAPSPTSSNLDFQYFRTKVQPVFLAKRPGHARCVACHVGATPLRLQPLPPGATSWDEEASRKNFDAVSRMVVPGSVKSKLLMHPLAPDAGGDTWHTGGPQFASQNDKEWQTLADWVRGAKASGSSR